MSTDVAVATQAQVDALNAQQDAEFDTDLLSTPIMKVGQPLTKEVSAEKAEAGDFIDTLAGESLGDKVEFIIAFYQKGRFAADSKTNRGYVAFGDTIPERWADLVGEDWVGTPFTEYPDAEETYKARANRKEIEWGSGPLVSTTHNFTGLVVVESPDPDEEAELRAVRLSLKRTDVPVVKKIVTLRKRALRNRSFWDKVFILNTEKQTYDRGMSYNVRAMLGRETTGAEKQAATELALAVQAGRTTDNQAETGAERAAEPDAKGGLAV